MHASDPMFVIDSVSHLTSRGSVSSGSLAKRFVGPDVATLKRSGPGGVGREMG
jgi:hypothetical protein